jgi:hypothetical protein
VDNPHQAVERERLIEQIRTGEYKSSIELILDSIGSILQKLFRIDKPPLPWVSAIAIALSISLIAYLSSLLVDDRTKGGYLTIVFGSGLIFANLVIAKLAFQRTYKSLAEKLLINLETDQGIRSVAGWLKSAGNFRWPILIGLIIHVTYIAFILPGPTSTPLDIVIIEAVIGGVLLFWTGFTIYYMCLFVVLPLRLSRCQLHLHREDPASTEVLANWSKMMSFAAYMFAIMLAAGTLFTISTFTFSYRTLFYIIPRWLPLIAIFIGNQMAISSVITKSKRKSLNEIETQMAELRSRGDSLENEKLRTLLLLWDYHDRIKTTRNTSLNINGIINFANTLLIPIAAFLLANRVALIELFG